MFVIPGKIGGGRGPGGTQANKLLLSDSANLKTKLSGEAQVSAVIQKVGAIKAGSKSDKNVTIAGVESNYTKLITAIKFDQGRFFNVSEADGGRHVVVIGRTVVTKLFPSSSSLGKEVDISGISYTVIGVTSPRGSTFGVNPDDIRNQFLIEAVILSSIGGIVGIVLGMLFSALINNFITTSTPLWSVLLSFGFSMVVGVIFGVAPAISASRLDPIQALRYE